MGICFIKRHILKSTVFKKRDINALAIRPVAFVNTCLQRLTCLCIKNVHLVLAYIEKQSKSSTVECKNVFCVHWPLCSVKVLKGLETIIKKSIQSYIYSQVKQRKNWKRILYFCGNSAFLFFEKADYFYFSNLIRVNDWLAFLGIFLVKKPYFPFRVCAWRLNSIHTSKWWICFSSRLSLVKWITFSWPFL